MSGRAHPVMILTNLRRVLFLLIIPALHGVLTVPRGGLVLWLQGAWLDSLTLIVMLVISVLMWRRCTYTCTSAGITVFQGLLFSHRTTIAWSNIVTLSCVTPFFARMLRASFFRADTVSGSFRDVDIRLWLSSNTVNEIMAHYHFAFSASEAKVTYKSTKASVLALALLSSSALTGVVFAAAVLSQASKLFGKEFSDSLILGLEQTARGLTIGIPPAATAIAYMLLLGWFIAALKKLLSYWHLKVERKINSIDIKSGRLGLQRYIISTKAPAFLDIRQTLGMRLAGTSVLYISAAGYGKHKNDIACVLPAMRKAAFEREYAKLFTGLLPSPVKIRPKRNGFLPYIIQPLCIIFSLVAAAATAFSFAARFGSFILFMLLMLLVPALVLLAVSIAAYRTSGISRSGDAYTLRYSRGFALHTVVVPAHKIVGLDINQNFFQRRADVCHIAVSAVSERQYKHKCLGLPIREVKALFDID